MDRRSFVKNSLGAFAAAHLPLPLRSQSATQSQTGAELQDLPSLWDVDRSIANLENAY